MYHCSDWHSSRQVLVWSLVVVMSFSHSFCAVRFDTGHAILSLLLNEVPQLVNSLSKLWPTLIAMACQNAGNERLKVIGLLRVLLMREIQVQRLVLP